MLLNNEQCKTGVTLINLNPVQLQFCPFMISFDKCNGSCNTFDNFSSEVSGPNKKQNANVEVFNMITKINEVKTLITHILYGCKYKFHSTICNSNRKWNNETSQCNCKNHHTFKKNYSWNTRKYFCKNGKYFKSITDKLVNYM